MKSIQTLTVCSLSLIVFFYTVSAISQGRSDSIESYFVIDANQTSLQLKEGKNVSLEGLIWMAKSAPWHEVVSRSIVIELSAAIVNEEEQNRYGDIQGRIITQNFGWMQKYWLEKGSAIYRGGLIYSKKVSKILLQAENRARSEQRGVWKKLKIRQADKLEYSGKSASFNIVEGKVHQVRTIGGVTYLNFSEDWKTDFTAAILPKNRVNFRKQSWKLADLENKWIRVRGAMRYYNGPYMDVVFPDQIELLER